MVTEIPLTRGYVALVDDEGAERVLQHKWCVHFNGDRRYAKNQHGTMHRFLTGWPLVDHINGNGLDNRRENLRRATVQENNRNRRPRNQYKGVTLERRTGRWFARIAIDGHRIHLGTFDTPEAAAAAYDTAAREHFGEFAWLNFP
jgi:hypothetical protein